MPPFITEFIDFSPYVTDRIALEGRTKHEKVSDLVQRINSWLATKSQVEILSVESVQVSYGEPIPTTSVHFEEQINFKYVRVHRIRKNTPTVYVRGLRVWYRLKSSKEQPEILKYIHVVPNMKLGAKGESVEYYAADIASLFDTANYYLSSHPTTGRFTSAEVIPVYLGSDKINPELCAWSVGGVTHSYLDFLAIYYTVSDFALLLPELGFKDFIVGNTLPEEPIAEEDLQVQLRSWYEKQNDLRILRIHSFMDVVFREENQRPWPKEIDKIGENTTGRRLIFVWEKSTSNDFSLQCEVFVPKISFTYSWFRGVSISHEPQRQLLERVTDWIRCEGHKSGAFEVITGETVMLSIPPSKSRFVWLHTFIDWWWKSKKVSQSVVLKCCKVYYRGTQKLCERIIYSAYCAVIGASSTKFSTTSSSHSVHLSEITVATKRSRLAMTERARQPAIWQKVHVVGKISVR